jgi:hypothetical protein
MSAIVLTEEQMNILRRSSDLVAVCDPDGQVLGTVDPDRRHELIHEFDWRPTSEKTTYTGEQVRALLQYLETVGSMKARSMPSD